MRMFKKTKIREAIYNAILFDALVYPDQVKDTLAKEKYNGITFGSKRNFKIDYHKMEQMVSFLFAKKVGNRFARLQQDKQLLPRYKNKWYRYARCNGVVFRADNKVTCSNRLCPLCHSRILYRLWGDIEPFLGSDKELTLVIFKEPIHQEALSRAAGVLFSEKLINPLLSKTREYRDQYVRLPYWDYDAATNTSVLCMAVIFVHSKGGTNLVQIKKAVAELRVPYNTPYMETMPATKETMVEWFPKHFKYPLAMMLKDGVGGIEGLMDSNDWYRYKAQYPNMRRRK